MRGIVCIHRRVDLQTVGTSDLTARTALRYNVSVAAMLGQLLLLVQVSLIVSRGGYLSSQTLSHAWVVLVDGAGGAADRVTPHAVRGRYSVFVVCVVARAAVMGRRLIFAKVLGLLDRVKALLPRYVHAILHLLLRVRTNE